MTQPLGRGMLDTATLLLLGRLDDPAELPEEPVLSAVTVAELSVGPHVARTAEERVARQAHLQQAESDFDAIAFDAAAARAFGRVAASLCAAGRKPAARAFDALIAASAIAENVPLYTCNLMISRESTDSKCEPFLIPILIGDAAGLGADGRPFQRRSEAGAPSQQSRQ